MAFRLFLILILILTFAAADILAGQPPHDPPPPGGDLFVAPDRPKQAWPTPAFRQRNPNDPAVQTGRASVRWREWGPAVFAEAGKADKPVFLFITGEWCHWGKVMERSTFTDLEVATRLNEEFIPVRLNRDQRPDIDVRMQQAVQTICGSRGWPLCVCMTSDGKPFYGGTYFPVEDDPALGRTGMTSIIYFVMQFWRSKRADVIKQAAALDEALLQAADNVPVRGTPPEDLLNGVMEKMRAALDARAGGFFSSRNKDGAKFPAPRALDLALLHYARSKDKKSLEIVERTLDAMLKSGIYDQLAGGFHRYSTDRWWRQPRFEKLLVLNAEMLPVLLRAWKATGNARYKQAMEATLNCWTGMSDPTGTYFFGSQAADATGLDDGDYFTWTVRDIEAAFADDTLCNFAKLYFGVEESGDLPQSAPDRNVLFEAMPPAKAAEKLKLPAAGAEQMLARVRSGLLDERNRRPAPPIDKTIYVDGNALMAAAFIECGRGLEDAAITARGLKTLRQLLKTAVLRDKDGNVTEVVHALAADGRIIAAPKLSQDEAALALACSIAFEATKEAEFSDAADAALKRLDSRFWDKARGGYFDRAGDAVDYPGLKLPVKAFQDSSEPAANALAALASARMFVLTGRNDFASRASDIIDAFGGALLDLGIYGASLTHASEMLRGK